MNVMQIMILVTTAILVKSMISDEIVILVEIMISTEIAICAYSWGMRNTVVKHAEFATFKVLGGPAL